MGKLSFAAGVPFVSIQRATDRSGISKGNISKCRSSLSGHSFGDCDGPAGALINNTKKTRVLGD